MTTAGAGAAPTQGSAADWWGLRAVTVRAAGAVVIEGVTLAARPGEITAVVGGDGAGKSTTLRTLAGALRPSEGAAGRPPLREIGYVAAGSGVYADLTVDENLDFFGAAYGLSRAEIARRKPALLEQTGLIAARGRLAGRLSGGMRQKLALAAAIQHDPGLLVLDEPTTGIDPVSRSELWRMLAGVAAKGTAVVLATTYLDEAERAASVLVLVDGRPLVAGEPSVVVAAMPGVLGSATERPKGSQAWRRGRIWQIWAPDGVLPVGVKRTLPDLEDAVVVAELAAHRSADRIIRSTEQAIETPRPGLAGEAGAVLLATTDVSRRFGDVVAVDRVDVSVAGGEVVGLLGANGAGKTTLLRIALGLLPPTSGTAALFGEPPSRQTRSRLGYVSQNLGLYDDLTVGENMTFVRQAFGVAGDGMNATAIVDDEVLAAAGTLVRDLPLGLRRRVAFAVALGHAPDLLVLDEPTSGVDPLARARLWESIRAAAEAGAGVLVTTHHMAEAEQCDRLVVMAGGRVVAAGTVAEIVGELRAVEVRTDRWEAAYTALETLGLPLALVGRSLRVPNGDPVAIRRLLDGAGVTADLEVVPATFDEAFVVLSTADSLA